ncbi:MAG: DUF4974 domain-containing protein [Bacteroides sp.]|nr:DUF4974 domain-containing protein [Bacteroides sp.]
MDKYEFVLEVVEHPDRYTSEELVEIFTDPEMKEIYNILCKTDSAMKANDVVDVDREWSRFERKAAFHRRPFLLRGNRVASIAAIICTSIVAVAAGIAVTVAVSDHENEIKPTEKITGIAPSIVSEASEITDTDSMENQKEEQTAAVLFEDETLSVIMARIAETYGMEVKFGNEEVAGLHLYYMFDPSLTLDEVVEQLNNFESINITRNDNTLIID